MTVHEYGSREEWLRGRGGFLGGSDAYVILGYGHSEQSPIAIWQEKVYGCPEENDEPEMFTIGRDMESGIVNAFTRKTGYPASLVDGYKIYQHPKHTFLGTTLDAWADDGGPDHVPLECKLISHGFDEWKLGTPIRYQIQLQMQLACTGSSYGFICAVINNKEVVVNRHHYDHEFFEAAIWKLTKFWESVESGTLPSVDSSAAATRVIQQLHPNDNGLATILPFEAVAWAKALKWAKKHGATCARIEREAGNRLRAALGDCTYGVLPDGTIFSNKTQNRKGYTVEPSSGRVLRELKRLPKGIEYVDHNYYLEGDSESGSGEAGGSAHLALDGPRFVPDADDAGVQEV